MNCVILSGRLTRNPELRTTQSLKHVCQFTLAVNRGYGEETDFIECVCFNKVAENLVKYQSKGNMVEVNGHIQVNKYTDKDGKNQYRTIINVEMINYISQTKTGVKMDKNDEKQVYADMGNRINNDDQLPF